MFLSERDLESMNQDLIHHDRYMIHCNASMVPHILDCIFSEEADEYLTSNLCDYDITYYYDYKEILQPRKRRTGLMAYGILPEILPPPMNVKIVFSKRGKYVSI